MSKKAINNFKRVAVYIFVVLIIIFSTSCSIFTSTNTYTDDEPQAGVLYGPYKVVRVVDGDTLVVNINSDEVKVRLIGINTPESVHPDKKLNTEEGKLASNFTKSKVENKSVYLEFDEEIKDPYDRTLAYVFLDKEGKTMLQDIILKAGHAKIMTIEPNTKYAKHFQSLINER